MLEEAGYKVSTHTDREWIVTTSKGDDIVFKRDTGVCKGMPYIDLRDHAEDTFMIETVKRAWSGSPKRRLNVQI